MVVVFVGAYSYDQLLSLPLGCVLHPIAPCSLSID